MTGPIFNNSESANQVLKAAMQWNALPLPQLVTKLHGIIKVQEKDIERAIYGLGNFKLALSMAHYIVLIFAIGVP